jgi:hypothetical protein
MLEVTLTQNDSELRSQENKEGEYSDSVKTVEYWSCIANIASMRTDLKRVVSRLNSTRT